MMHRYLLSSLALVVTGCAQLPDWLNLPVQGAGASPQAVALDYNFHWQLSGDTQVAPLQAFDDGKSVWFQFPQGQAIPAIFQRTSVGYVPAAFRSDGPYVVIAGAEGEFMFRGGHLKAFAVRHHPDGHGADQSSVQPIEAKTYAVEPALSNPVTQGSAHTPERVSSTGGSSRVDVAPAQAGLDVTRFADPSETASTTRPSGVFRVGPSDENLRVALQRWSALAGWTFNAEQWAVDVDVPIAAKASFTSDFVTSVQNLVSATELSDRPLQPCFYSNQVLRVVPYSQPCDRTAVPGDAT